MATAQSADELRRAVEARVQAISDITASLMGPLPKSRTALKRVLSLVSALPVPTLEAVDNEWNRVSDPYSRVAFLVAVLRHLNWVADVIEKHLAHGTRQELSQTLMDEVHGELVNLGLDDYSVVIAHGPANNFETLHGDVAGALHQPLRSLGAVLPASAEKFALFRVPRVEGMSALWRPILIGHEVAHVGIREYSTLSVFGLNAKFIASDPSPVVAPDDDPSSPDATKKVLGLHKVATSWATEILCDVYALHRFGPAAIASLAEYFLSLGPTDSYGATHPPTDLRMRILLDLADAVSSTRIRPLVDAWDPLTPAAPSFGEPAIDHLATLFISHEADLLAAIQQLPSGQYSVNDRDLIIEAIADAFGSHLPASPILHLADGSFSCATTADVVNGAWVARNEDVGGAVGPLSEKTIEDHEFVRRWVAKGALRKSAGFDGVEQVPVRPSGIQERSDPVVA